MITGEILGGGGRSSLDRCSRVGGGVIRSHASDCLLAEFI
jgi:hypothetical protein